MSDANPSSSEAPASSPVAMALKVGPSNPIRNCWAFCPSSRLPVTLAMAHSDRSLMSGPSA